MNDQQKEIQNTIQILKKGGLILFPTDTIWGIGCDATNAAAVDKIYALKQRDESKALICLVNDFKMLNRHVENIPEVAYDILRYASKPTTIIYDQPINIAENLLAPDQTLAIRVAQRSFCKDLVQKFKKPIVATSANISGKATPKSYAEISTEILKGVDYIVPLQSQKMSTKPSAIIKLSNDGVVQVIRK
ncbi:L-threonylcarbamoyladenylate synthase [Gangjinia marincola]|uniref:L-threonylcarbamoyladenylate synthase n=1 Tax=Gangjinia marincola TaxID=578463 RepID=A0ABP3XV16_9FLAO